MPNEPPKIGIFEYLIWAVFKKNPASGASASRTPWFVAHLFILFHLSVRVQRYACFRMKNQCENFQIFLYFVATFNFKFLVPLDLPLHRTKKSCVSFWCSAGSLTISHVSGLVHDFLYNSIQWVCPFLALTELKQFCQS